MLTDAAALRPFLIGSEHLMRARVVEVDDHHGIVVVTRERHDRLDVLGGRERCFEDDGLAGRSEEHTSELQSLMRISYAVFCLKKKKNKKRESHNTKIHTK